MKNNDWKIAVTCKKIYIWRVMAMLNYLDNMIVDGKYGYNIREVIDNYKKWIQNEVND